MTLARMHRLKAWLRAPLAALVALAVLAPAAHASPLHGTSLDDRLRGTPRADDIRAGAGDDVVFGRGGADRVTGGAGADTVDGEAGADILAGGHGDDALTGGPGLDRLFGGPGRDLIRARNGGRDRVDCGPGRDTAILDPRDVAFRCEVVRRPRPAKPASTTPTVAGPPAPVPAAKTEQQSPAPAADPLADPPTDPSVDPPADPLPPPPPPPGDDYPQLLAAGDIADCTAPSEQTATLLDGLRGTVATLGDTAYPSGSAADFANCYEPTWGRHKNRTRPAIGSHEYDTPGAVPYWEYFGEAAGEAGKGWYSYDIGSWHVVVLNGRCAEVGGCHEGSEQYEWLRADLEGNPAQCTAAYWDTPRYSSGERHGDDLTFVPFWQLLYEHGVEFVMGGNDHQYERFAPQTPYGDLDLSDGVRQFVVGTGGRFLRPLSATPSANSETRDNLTFGVLRVGLLEDSYEWEFVPVEGGTYTDSGSTGCH